MYYASTLIAEGSDLLLLVPSMAGLVGGVVLPLLGAVPDGAIMLFSGLGNVEDAQDTLSIGIGALAGSTIMLLTIPWGMSVINGRVDIDPDTGVANYLGKPKLTPFQGLHKNLMYTGITITDNVRNGAIVMMVTTIPYFLIQGPASSLHGPAEEIAIGEHWWALLAFLFCVCGFLGYMYLQLEISRQGEDKDRRVAVMKKLLRKGLVSLSGALNASLRSREGFLAYSAALEYQAMQDDDSNDTPTPSPAKKFPPPSVQEYLKEILTGAFFSYDRDRDGNLDKLEVFTFFRDFHEQLSETEMDRLFEAYDMDNSGHLSLDEFIALCYGLIIAHDHYHPKMALQSNSTEKEFANSVWHPDTEEEEVPKEFTDLSPKEQQVAIKRRAFGMLAIGTILGILFSDPMVKVMEEIANRLNIPAFYVSFVLAPLALNASEVIASQYYARKKTHKTITVALNALEGVVAMNNTFCLSIFMGLIFFRRLAWQYTAETIAIVAVEFILFSVSLFCKTLTVFRGVMIIALFPLSLVLVATLKSLGFS